MKDARIKKWEKLEYSSPRKALLDFRKVEESHDFSTTAYEISSLRTHELRPWNEERQLALFCYGISTILESDVAYWFGEDDDYDGIVLTDEGFSPIQLKELPPEWLGNPRELEQELEKLKNKYSGGDVIVAYYLNRSLLGFDWREVVVPELDVAELWFFGALSPDGNKWFISGDMLKNPQGFEFDYPVNV